MVDGDPVHICLCSYWSVYSLLTAAEKPLDKVGAAAGMPCAACCCCVVPAGCLLSRADGCYPACVHPPQVLAWVPYYQLTKLVLLLWLQSPAYGEPGSLVWVAGSGHAQSCSGPLHLRHLQLAGDEYSVPLFSSTFPNHCHRAFMAAEGAQRIYIEGLRPWLLKYQTTLDHSLAVLLHALVGAVSGCGLRGGGLGSGPCRLCCCWCRRRCCRCSNCSQARRSRGPTLHAGLRPWPPPVLQRRPELAMLGEAVHHFAQQTPILECELVDCCMPRCCVAVHARRNGTSGFVRCSAGRPQLRTTSACRVCARPCWRARPARLHH